MNAVHDTLHCMVPCGVCVAEVDAIMLDALPYALRCRTVKRVTPYFTRTKCCCTSTHVYGTAMQYTGSGVRKEIITFSRIWWGLINYKNNGSHVAVSICSGICQPMNFFHDECLLIFIGKQSLVQIDAVVSGFGYYAVISLHLGIGLHNVMTCYQSINQKFLKCWWGRSISPVYVREWDREQIGL